MNCPESQRLMSSYLDSAVTRSQFSAMQKHLEVCGDCSAHYLSLQRTQGLVSALGRKSAPVDLTLRVRVAVSQEIANSQRSRWEMLSVHWENVFNAVMVPATGGLITTIIIFGLLISFLMPGQAVGPNDVPTTLYTPPQLESTPFQLAMGVGHLEPLIVEAYVGADGRVQDYRVLSGGENGSEVLAQLKNTLIFATFRPATSFGRPTAGRAILAFSKIQVKG
jgi:predicted anti-sigma-YlaC factor YlaD